MNKSLAASLTLSGLSLALTVWINLSLASRYQHADGKTRALFGWIELTYGFQYWVLILGFAALIFALRGRGGSRLRLGCVLLSLCSMVLVFARIWRLFI